MRLLIELVITIMTRIHIVIDKAAQRIDSANLRIWNKNLVRTLRYLNKLNGRDD